MLYDEYGAELMDFSVGKEIWLYFHYYTKLMFSIIMETKMAYHRQNTPIISKSKVGGSNTGGLQAHTHEIVISPYLSYSFLAQSPNVVSFAFKMQIF